MYTVLNSALMYAFDIGSFLQNATSTLENWLNFAIIALGVIMLGKGGYEIGMYLMGNQQSRKQHDWKMGVLLLIVGGAFFTAGMGLLKSIGEGGQKTINDLGNGSTILPLIQPFLPH